MDIAVSAVICTRNRAPYLRKAISSLARQTLDGRRYEIIVVDNASTDETPQVARNESLGLPALRYIQEPALGLSRARNTGWRAARGVYVAFLDDDGVASSDWLETILRVFESTDPRPVCVGGKVNLIWEASRPQWLGDGLLWTLGERAVSDSPVYGRHMAGCNMAFTRECLDAVGGFSTRLGRKGKSLLSCEENLLFWEIERRGWLCLYHPDILIEHHVPGPRMKKKWFLRRYFWEGVSDVVLDLHQESRSFGERLRQTGKDLVSVNLKAALGLLLPTDEPESMRKKCDVFHRIGRIAAWLGIIGNP